MTTGLAVRAQLAGFALAVVSGYRSYERQLAIFNAKAQGRRAVMDDHGKVLPIDVLAPAQRLHAILRFSALPGTSRHHWGTDFDIIDRAAVPPHYTPQLEPREYSGNGPFAPLASWLAERIAADDAEGFFRPYDIDCGGVAPEPWHLSYRPATDGLRALQSAEVLVALWRGEISSSGASGKGETLALLDIIAPQVEALLTRYVVP